MCRQISARIDAYATREVSLFSDDTVHSLKKRISVQTMLWIKHMNYGS